MSAQDDARVQWAAAREGAAAFDLSQEGHVELTGPDAIAFLHNLCTNDIKNLAPGCGCEFFLTTNKARAVAFGVAHRLLPAEPPVLWLDLAPGMAAKVMAHLNHFIVSEQVEIADRTGSVCQYHVCGPNAAAVIKTAWNELELSLDPLQHINVAGWRFTRFDGLNLPGYDVVCPVPDGPKVLNRLTAVGAIAALPQVFDVLRVEAGVPVDGIDIDAERFVVEVGRNKQAICYTKGCYLGQEPIVMARDRGHVNRVLMGLNVDAAEPLPAGTKVTRNDEEVGQVTSSVYSPLMESVIALAYLKRGHQEPGTVMDVGSHSAVVATLPFAKA